MRQYCFIAMQCFALSLVAFSENVDADVRLPAIVGSRMVLQRGMPLPIWGWADPGEPVRVTIAGQKHMAIADDEGNWRVTLNPLRVGTPHTMVVEGKNRLELIDILIGEVWLCSGQSNMQWPMSGSWNGDLEIRKAKHPEIRLITVDTLGSQTPVKDFDGQWQPCSPATVGSFSAVGYYFGREIHEQCDVPIGLIDNAWGGSACEAWVRRDLLENDSSYAPLMERWKKIESEYDVEAERAKFEQQLANWKKGRDEARAAGKPVPRRPWWNNPLAGNHRPGNLFNCRLHPVLPFGIRGAIWYQGETNAERAYQYREMFPLMIRNWREDWKQGDFPFYWVQLADYKHEKNEPQESAWAELREAQTMALDRVANGGQAVIIDLGEGSDIHPKNKQEVGRRLARLALTRNYGITVEHASPRYRSMRIEGNKVLVTLSDCGQGLRWVDSHLGQGFTIAGADKKWHNAKAKIVRHNRVEVWSEEVAEPVAVRYAWADNPICNLYAQSGLPATPFRTDNWPGVTAEAK